MPKPSKQMTRIIGWSLIGLPFAIVTAGGAELVGGPVALSITTGVGVTVYMLWMGIKLLSQDEED